MICIIKQHGMDNKTIKRNRNKLQATTQAMAYVDENTVALLRACEKFGVHYEIVGDMPVCRSCNCSDPAAPIRMMPSRALVHATAHISEDDHEAFFREFHRVPSNLNNQ